MNQIVAKNKKLQSGIKIAKNFNHNLEQRIVEKNLTEGGRGGGGAIQPQKQCGDIRHNRQHS